MPDDRLPQRLPLVVTAAALLFSYHRLLLGEVFFWGLPALQFYPWREYALALLRNGYLPLWNPFNGAGVPLLANYQSALLYPFTWATFALPLASAMSALAVLHLFIASWGMWAFTGRLGLPVLGRGVSALAFGLSAYLVARLGTYPIVTAAAWIPWLLWAVLRVTRCGRPRDAGWLAVVVALLMLAGHAQTAWYGLLLAGLFVLYELIRTRSSDWYRQAGLALTGVVLGIGIAAIQLLATAELMGTSQRSSGVNYDFAMNFSYGPARALDLLSPNVFGTPADGSYITEGAYFEDAVYIGLIPLVAAFAAVVIWVWRRVRREQDVAVFWQTVPFWVLVTVVAFVLALGRYTPVFPFLFDHVPTFNLFQAPVRWHIWTVFALSVLAGIGTQAWGKGHWLFFSTRLATAGCVGAVILALVAVPRILPPDVYETAGVSVLIAAVVYTGIMGALAGALTLLQPDTKTWRHLLWSLMVLVVIAFDLSWSARGLNPTVPAAFFDRSATGDEHTGRAYWPKDAADAVMFERFLPFKDYRVATENWQAFRASGLPNLNLIDRRSLLNDFDPLLPGHHAAYVDLIEASAQPAALLQAAGVDGVYSASGELVTLTRPAVGAWFPAVLCWHADDAGVYDALASPDWDPLAQAHLVGNGECAQPAAEVSAPGSVKRVRLADSGMSLEVEVETETGGLLVVADTDYPGWVAAVDDVPVRILRVNGTFRAVEVPAGARQVRFIYQPGWLLPGVMISVAALLLIVLLFRLKNPNTTEP